MSFPADAISAALAFDLAAVPIVLGVVTLRLLSTRQEPRPPFASRLPALRPQKPAERPAAVIPAAGSMPRHDAAKALRISDRDVQGLCNAGVVRELPWIGRVPQVSAKDVSALLASRNGQESGS